KRGKLDTPISEERVGDDEKGVQPLTQKGSECRIDVADGAGVEDVDLQPEGARGCFNVSRVGRGTDSIGRVDEDGNASCFRHQLMQQSQPLCGQLSNEKIDPRRIATRSGEACDETELDGIIADTKDDWDRRGCRLGRERRGSAARDGDYSHLLAG